jgi:hypothetical protein
MPSRFQQGRDNAVIHVELGVAFLVGQLWRRGEMARRPIGQKAFQGDDLPGDAARVGRHCSLDGNAGASKIAIEPRFWSFFGRRSFGNFRNHESNHDVGDAGPELCPAD